MANGIGTLSPNRWHGFRCKYFGAKHILDLSAKLLSIRDTDSLSFRYGQNVSSEVVTRFLYAGDSLHISPVYLHLRTSDILIGDTSTTTLQHIGIEGNKAIFFIEWLSDDKMILQSKYSRIHFAKF